MKKVAERKEESFMRPLLRILVVITAGILLQASIASAAELSIFPHVKEQPQNAFQGEGRALNAHLFAFKISGWGKFKADRFAFRLYLDGEIISPGSNYELYIDQDEDGVIKPGADKKIGGPGKLVSRRVVFSEPFDFDLSGPNISFLVRADFPKLAPGFALSINVDPEETVIKDQGGNKVTLKLGDKMYSGKHFEPYPIIAAKAMSRSPVIVGNQDIEIFVDVTYLRGIEPFWADLHQVPGWTLKDVPQMSGVQGVDLTHQRILITLAQKPGMSVGKYVIPELVISYRDSAAPDSKLKTGRVRTSAFTIRKELILAEVSILPHRISLADPLPYELRLLLDPNYTVPDDYLDEMRLREFWGEFKVSSPTLKVFKEEGLGVISFKAVLSYLGAPAKEAILPKEMIPYVKIGDASQELFTYNLPEIRFPLNSVVVKKNFDSLETWRSVFREEAKFFGRPVSFFTTNVPLWLSGLMVLYLGVREIVLSARRRKFKTTSLHRRWRAKTQLRGHLVYTSDVDCYEASQAIRKYVGALVGESGDFARSASFIPWLRARYPDETNILKTLCGLESLMLEDGLDRRTQLSLAEKQEIYCALRRIASKERILRLRRKMYFHKVR